MGIDGTISIHDHRLSLHRLLFAAHILSGGLQRERHGVGPAHGHDCFYFVGLELSLCALDEVAAYRQGLRIKLSASVAD